MNTQPVDSDSLDPNQTDESATGFRPKKKRRSRVSGQHLLPQGPCTLCGAPSSKTIVHHKDGDFTNDAPYNLERICRSCHGFRHSLSDRTEVVQKTRRAVETLIRKYDITSIELSAIVKLVRKKLNLHHANPGKRLPKLMTDGELRRFYDVIDKAKNLQHQVMFRLLLYTAVRISEFVKIRRDDVDFDANKIFIRQGKGEKDRYILFPEKYRLLLSAYLEAYPHGEYLFESRKTRSHYTPRRIQQIVQHYAEEAEIETHVHPHLLRHQMLTWLTRQGLPDSQIQLVSGHASKNSLEVYQHLSLKDIQEGYQKAAREIDI